MRKPLTPEIIKQLEIARPAWQNAVENAEDALDEESDQEEAWDYAMSEFEQRLHAEFGFTEEQIENLKDFEQLYNNEPLIILTPETDAVFRDILRSV
jgi:hypothetical protein